ncbi:hypothetical protein AMECASPLE_003511 [Ameca splendens]|uniref:Aquaporin NIP n=1 Tax=Ameca splendens TaxID=208324 RepID=A0ABV0YWK4_9TELE
MKEKFGLRQDILKEFLAEFLGIFVLILFGCGSVAQTVLSKGALGEPLTIHVGFTLGVMMAVYMAGGVSGKRGSRVHLLLELHRSIGN